MMTPDDDGPWRVNYDAFRDLAEIVNNRGLMVAEGMTQRDAEFIVALVNGDIAP